jgi:hypothetical protein
VCAARANLTTTLRTALVACACLLLTAGAHAHAGARQPQQTRSVAASDAAAPGIAQYKRGETDAAIKSLRAAMKKESAIKAARKIKFIPATKDGSPVSRYVTIDYNFNIY